MHLNLDIYLKPPPPVFKSSFWKWLDPPLQCNTLQRVPALQIYCIRENPLGDIPIGPNILCTEAGWSLSIRQKCCIFRCLYTCVTFTRSRNQLPTVLYQSARRLEHYCILFKLGSETLNLQNIICLEITQEGVSNCDRIRQACVNYHHLEERRLK